LTIAYKIFKIVAAAFFLQWVELNGQKGIGTKKQV